MSGKQEVTPDMQLFPVRINVIPPAEERAAYVELQFGNMVGKLPPALAREFAESLRQGADTAERMNRSEA